MRLGIVTDIHANREAFDACLARLARENVSQMVVLGDVVGYGADPAYAVERTMALAESGAIVLRGNHDQAVRDTREGMNPIAKIAMEWTRSQLSGAQADYLAALPLTQRVVDVMLTHANAWAPGDFEYMRTPRDAERNMMCTDAHLTLCGHTHVPSLFYAAPKRPAQIFQPTAEVPVPLSGRLQWVAVVGAVGQPRHGVPAASCATYDVDQRRLTFHRVPYDVETAARKIRAAGLPDVLADRLHQGR